MSILPNIKSELEKSCNLIDSGKDLINILSKPVTTYYEAHKLNSSLFNVWLLTTISFANDRKNFLLLGQQMINSSYSTEAQMFRTHSTYWYKYTKLDLLKLCIQQYFRRCLNRRIKYVNYFSKNIEHQYDPRKGEWRVINKNLSLLNLQENYRTNYFSQPFIEELNGQWKLLNELIGQNHSLLSKIDNDRPLSDEDQNNINRIVKCIEECKKIEELNKKEMEKNILCLLICIIRYVEIFEEQSININVWNYCLRSKEYISKYIYIGILILICQCTMITVLIYYCTTNFIEMYHNQDLNNNITHDPLIIITAVVATIISSITSYDMVQSFLNTRPLYLFSLYQLFKTYSTLEKQDNCHGSQALGYYNNLMNRHIIRMNFYMDMISNLFLPLLIPLLNIYIILFTTDTVVDAILNSVALYFIINLDEELFTFSSHEIENYTRGYISWVIGTIYTQNFDVWKSQFRMEYETWFNTIFKYVLGRN